MYCSISQNFSTFYFVLDTQVRIICLSAQCTLSKQCTISLIDFALRVVYIWFGYRVTRIYLVWFPFLCTTTIYSISTGIFNGRVLFPSGSVSAHLSSANNRESGAVSYTATASSNTQLPDTSCQLLIQSSCQLQLLLVIIFLRPTIGSRSSFIYSNCLQF